LVHGRWDYCCDPSKLCTLLLSQYRRIKLCRHIDFFPFSSFHILAGSSWWLKLNPSWIFSEILFPTRTCILACLLCNIHHRYSRTVANAPRINPNSNKLFIWRIWYCTVKYICKSLNFIVLLFCCIWGSIFIFNFYFNFFFFLEIEYSFNLKGMEYIRNTAAVSLEDYICYAII